MAIKQDSAGWWKRTFCKAPTSSEVDHLSRDGSMLIEIQAKPQGMRGVYLGLIKLAIELERNPAAEIGCLVLDASQLNADRLEADWTSLLQLFNPRIANRLAIVAKQKSKVWVSPQSQVLNQIASVAPELLQSSSSRLVDKTLEINKVLLLRWLLDQGPIRIGELKQHVGCSYPTVRMAVQKLEAQEYLHKSSNVKVELRRFPEDLWQSMVALAPETRQPRRFVDRSGQPADLQGLIARLNRLAPERVAFGGVISARHWQPTFDLNGIPRIDLIVHGDKDAGNADFMRQLDPALKESRNINESPVIVFHFLSRAVPDFTSASGHRLPIADPVETALDLMEIGLTKQANNLFAHFRKEIPLA